MEDKKFKKTSRWLRELCDFVYLFMAGMFFSFALFFNKLEDDMLFFVCGFVCGLLLILLLHMWRHD